MTKSIIFGICQDLISFKIINILKLYHSAFDAYLSTDIFHSMQCIVDHCNKMRFPHTHTLLLSIMFEFTLDWLLSWQYSESRECVVNWFVYMKQLGREHDGWRKEGLAKQILLKEISIFININFSHFPS